MVFSSHIFIFYFLPLCLLLYYSLPRRLKNGFLTLFSYVFYGWFEPWYILLMLTSTFVDYFAARQISAQDASALKRKTALVVSLFTNLGLLGAFKYAVFAQENLNWLLHTFGASGFDVLQVTLPIGISFYTFQTISYTVDVYTGRAEPVRRFSDFSCFVALFPQLVAGPIVRYNTVSEQLANREHTLTRFCSGLSLFILGFAKKILLANPLGELADAVFGAQQVSSGAFFQADATMLGAWLAIVAFALQIYFDFSGYSDMAVGLGRMLGFEFIKNFDDPYQSQSITEFWRRWHISLSTFLRDYLYFPLGGNRHGRIRTYVNLATVMLLGGLWHGAKWTFVIWGAYHGLLLICERANGKRSFVPFAPWYIQRMVTFVLVLVGWVFFRADDVPAALHHLGAMIGWGGNQAESVLLYGQLLAPGPMVMLGVCVLLSQLKIQAWDVSERLSAMRMFLILALFITSVGAMFAQQHNPFLYFQF